MIFNVVRCSHLQWQLTRRDGRKHQAIDQSLRSIIWWAQLNDFSSSNHSTQRLLLRRRRYPDSPVLLFQLLLKCWIFIYLSFIQPYKPIEVKTYFTMVTWPQQAAAHINGNKRHVFSQLAAEHWRVHCLKMQWCSLLSELFDCSHDKMWLLMVLGIRNIPARKAELNFVLLIARHHQDESTRNV